MTKTKTKTVKKKTVKKEIEKLEIKPVEKKSKTVKPTETQAQIFDLMQGRKQIHVYFNCKKIKFGNVKCTSDKNDTIMLKSEIGNHEIAKHEMIKFLKINNPSLIQIFNFLKTRVK